MVFLFPPLKPPSPQISVTKVLIVCYCHDKRLRVFLSLIQLFFTIYIVVLIFVFSIQNGRLFSISQKRSSSDRNFKNKNSRTF